MNRIRVQDYLAKAAVLAGQAQQQSIPYVPGGMALSGMDCQGLCEYLLMRCGISRKACNLSGSNAHYRACLWTGTPEECRQRFGSIPAGAWLFIVKNDGKEPVKYRSDGIGNASHMGVYLGEGGGALHASSSRGGVTVGVFSGVSGSGGWNRVGLCQWVDYGMDMDVRADEADVFFDTARISTPDGNPVKLRAKPSRKCCLYWKVPDGAAVQAQAALEAEGTIWIKARYENRTGYIMSAFIIGG